MNQADILKEKGVIITEVKENGKDFRKQWENKFVSHLSKAEKNEIYLKQILWHVFSYEKKPCFKKQDAVNAFNLVHKNECFIFYQDSEKVLILENADNMSADDIKNTIDPCVVDVYVVDKDYTWTYVVTHESYCGPYFYFINSSLR